MPIFNTVKRAQGQGATMLILNAMLAMAFVIMVAILVKDVFDARRAD
jgi:TPP-dependent trihydroxycyclohexane-1,2-dione (THcHDO) dehydratase